MAWLFCAEHGRENEERVIRRQEEIRQDGESVLIVKGTLIRGTWRCDSCNALLDEGDRASLYAPYPRSITENIYEYDFSYERDYFALEGEDEITFYGAAWPGGTAAEMLEIAGRSGNKASRLREHED